MSKRHAIIMISVRIRFCGPQCVTILPTAAKWDIPVP